MEKEVYKRLNLKNGWDLPKDEKPPLTGHRQYLLRAYELLIKKEDEEYYAGFSEPEQRKKAEAFSQEMQKSRTPYDGTGENAQPGLADHIKKEHAQPDILAEARAADDEGWKRKRRLRLRITSGVLAAIVALCLCRVLLGPGILTADISSYKDVTIEIVGVTDQPFFITPAELSSMKKKSISVPVHEGETAPDEVPENGKAIGPTLETFLKKYGKTTDDFRSMRVYTQKETSTAYARSMKEEELILSIANGRNPLGERQAPLRIASESMRPEEWSGWIRRIEFIG